MQNPKHEARNPKQISNLKILNSKRFGKLGFRICSLFRISDLEFRIYPQKGFTLIETVVVISIIVVLAASGLISFIQSRNVRELASAGQNVLSTLRLAQAKSLAGEDNSTWGVRLEPDRFTLFRGADFLSSTSTQVFALDSRIEVSNISLNGGGAEIVFEKLNGATVQYGAFEVRI